MVTIISEYKKKNTNYNKNTKNKVISSTIVRLLGIFKAEIKPTYTFLINRLKNIKFSAFLHNKNYDIAIMFIAKRHIATSDIV